MISSVRTDQQDVFFHIFAKRHPTGRIHLSKILWNQIRCSLNNMLAYSVYGHIRQTLCQHSGFSRGYNNE